METFERSGAEVNLDNDEFIKIYNKYMDININDESDVLFSGYNGWEGSNNKILRRRFPKR